jgi:DNA invertase Pin-like site-specific DNA recombinase
MKPLAYSYRRFSHPDQAEGASFRRQGELRDAWLERNKVKLDTSLTLEDKGVSGFTGEHRNNADRHALAKFLEQVQRGRIAKGSYLIVESLDRLSREHILQALTLLLNLIGAGIRIVQLLPVEQVYDDKVQPMNLMMAIMELSRGHSESAVKSERVGHAWREKKTRARQGEPCHKNGSRVITGRGPDWLKLKDNKWKIIPSAARTVRLIYRLATQGHGIAMITKKLTALGIPVISKGKNRGKHWAKSYVAKILNNRAVIGEYQPFTGRGEKRQPDGAPIPNYYPALMDEDQFNRARLSIGQRRGKPGRMAKRGVNIFAGLLHDALAEHGDTLQLARKGDGRGRLLIPASVQDRRVKGTHSVSFPFDVFEKALLSQLKEIKPSEILDETEPSADRTAVLSGLVEELTGEIEKLKHRLQARFSDPVADVLDRQEAKRKLLAEELAQAKQEATSPIAESWGEAQSLIGALDGARDKNAVRIRLRAALRRIIEGIYCAFTTHNKRPSMRLAYVTVVFKGVVHWAVGCNVDPDDPDPDVQRFESALRNIWIRYEPATGGSVGKRPARWSVRSIKHPDTRLPFETLDLRNYQDALDSTDVADWESDMIERRFPLQPI